MRAAMALTHYSEYNDTGPNDQQDDEERAHARDKHKAPSLPLRRPLSLQPRPSSSATRCIESLPSTPPLVPTPLQTIPKEHTCVSIPPFRLLSLRAINPILFVLTQSPAGNNICTLAPYETANNLYGQSAYHSRGDRIEYVPDAFRRP